MSAVASRKVARAAWLADSSPKTWLSCWARLRSSRFWLSFNLAFKAGQLFGVATSLRPARPPSMPRKMFAWAASFSIPLSAFTMISSWADSSAAGKAIDPKIISNRQAIDFIIGKKERVDHLDVLKVTPQERSVPKRGNVFPRKAIH